MFVKYPLQSTYLINCPKGEASTNTTLLQPMLHVSHPLLQFTDVTDPLLSTVALFSKCRFRSEQLGQPRRTLLDVLRFHMQYVIEIGSNKFQIL